MYVLGTLGLRGFASRIQRLVSLRPSTLDILEVGAPQSPPLVACP